MRRARLRRRSRRRRRHGGAADDDRPAQGPFPGGGGAFPWKRGRGALRPGRRADRPPPPGLPRAADVPHAEELCVMLSGVKARSLVALASGLIALVGAGWPQLNEAGKAAYARAQYAEAERLFRQAIAAAPDEPELHYHRAVALTHLHRWAEAAAAYEQALALRPPASLAAAVRQGLRSVEPMTRPRVAATPEPEAATPVRPRRRPVELPPDTVPVR